MTQTRKDKWIELGRIVGFTLPVDPSLTQILGKLVLDVSRFDREMDKYNKDYDSIHCTCNGQEEVSTSMAVKILYGDRAQTLVRELIS